MRIIYLTVACVLSLPTWLYGQWEKEISFDEVGTDQGLSYSQVDCILEDPYGFIWVGTLSGLNRYDGYHFQTFYHDAKDPNSIPSNAIIWIDNGPDSTIWINTGQGIAIYDPRVEQFVSSQDWADRVGIDDLPTLNKIVQSANASWFLVNGRELIRYDHEGISTYINSQSDSYIELSDVEISDIQMDDEDNLWILYRNGTIDVINTQIAKVTRKFDLSQSTANIGSLGFFIDSNQDIWLYSSGGELGLIYYNTTNGDIKQLDEKVMGSNIVRTLIEDGDGFIWVGTDHGGITVVNKEEWLTKNYRYQANNPASIGNNSIISMLRSSQGIIWIGKSRKGLSYYNEKAGKFTHYKYPNEDPSYNDILSLAEDASGDLWIGTNGKGLLRFDQKTKKIEPMNVLQSGQSARVPDIIVSMYYSSDQSLWLGTYTKGLYRYKNGRLTQYRQGEAGGISDDNIWDIYEDSKKDLWLGTLLSGLDRLDTETGEIENYSTDSGLPTNYVTDITEDDQNRIWIATGVGLSVYDQRHNSFKNYSVSDSLPGSLSSNSVVCLLNDSRGNIWVGTLNGLNRYLPEEDAFEVYNKEDGLASDIIMSVLEDETGNLWISTDNGLSKLTFDEGELSVQTYSVSDGLQGNYYNERAGIITQDGMLAYGGQNGLNFFHPEKIDVNDQPPLLVFTQFYLNSQPVKPLEEINEQVILKKNLNEQDQLELRYDQNSFGFEFAALTFDQASGNNYEYRLEGFDDQWLKVSADIRQVTYTNINPGSYRFRVRASNSHNVWSEEELTMGILIHPPFWKTIWAYIFYFIVLFVLLFLTRGLIVRREREKAKIENERLDAQRLHELDLMKLKFFTNISHEFRTPISLVLTPIERMIKHPDDIRQVDFHVIHRNAKRLLTLVNQLLDFRKMEANQHSLHYSSGDLVKFIQDVVDSFSDLSKEKDIALSFESDLTQYYTSFDKDKMDKILFNLLSNAFKFTFEGGKIDIALELNEKGHVVISVADTGIGIPADKQEAVFDRFIQSEIKPNMINSGTGIGLSITKEFVELHGGNISVESEKDDGSTFFVELPLKQVDHMEEELDEHEGETSPIPVEDSEEKERDENKPNVFIVEDNADFRFYLKDNLKQYFNVSESFNGKEAWKKIVAQHPDMVISDVMMPVMNGLDLCKKIKNDPRTSNIPVILLTAQTSEEHKIMGLEAGAIECISKPVNFEILASTISSALKFQKRVNESSQRVKAEPEKIEVVSRDEKLVQDALELVEKNMSNSDFGVEEMSHELGFSRGYLYQKMLKITGETPMDFIRNIRIKRAAELLTKSQMTVSEVAYAVGYNNPKLFSRYFKSVYKMYPSQYMAEKQGK
ncbi:hybrid sensor histidine kinase/response regulator transcription factor [Reichenbachiella ulvae]|uniref:histidine kinase n=1 Tax=Reichenbachiella ulvae TaxID=2980104 RepID=A0ABT3CN20_9BACT|nr:hybrid sensor histidine kinase/response regulator transcription factor [Reichenbachiella ulvae]MCV9385098.1 ATP-binding protein [Reichenbachiella ulvae]